MYLSEQKKKVDVTIPESISNGIERIEMLPLY